MIFAFIVTTILCLLIAVSKFYPPVVCPITHGTFQIPYLKSHFMSPTAPSFEVSQDDKVSRETPPPKRLIVAMTGATGAIIGIRLLQRLRDLQIETHLVISKWASATISWETEWKISNIKALATRTYSDQDVAAPISSGSFKYVILANLVERS